MLGDEVEPMRRSFEERCFPPSEDQQQVYAHTPHHHQREFLVLTYIFLADIDGKEN